MIESITKAFESFSKRPFLFIWGTLMYIILLLAFFFAALGIVMAYFVVLSLLDKELDPTSPASLIIAGALGLVFIFFSNGLNGALARAYRSAVWKEKTSLTKFFSYSLEKTLEMFGIMVVRDALWLLLAGPVIALYFYFLATTQYMDILVGLYVMSVTFIMHMLFTPAFISAGALDMGIVASMKHAFEFVRRKHLFFVVIYALFAVVWALNFIPFIQFVTLFFAYPLLYSALIIMMEEAMKGGREEKEVDDE
ncbi:MAG: hypothetical protein V1827_04750 [Candidatus Micrarchaeota archaeon]